MASYSECLTALPAFRNDLMQRQQLERLVGRTPFVARGAFAAFATPLSNVHATGVGIRQRGGSYVLDEHVLKVFVFDKVEPAALGEEPMREYEGIPVDVEQLPVQLVRARAGRSQTAVAAGARPAPAPAPAATLPGQRTRHRPIIAGLSISPLDAQFVGTLGCFLRRRRADEEDTFALSNNHVLADINQLPRGTEIVQPGPEQPPFTTPVTDVFAALSGFIELRFPTNPDAPPVNRFDAAIARVTDLRLIQPGTVYGGVLYRPDRVVPPVPGMRVVKAGRTTGVTHGVVTATEVDGVQVNYGSRQFPRIATFDGTVEVVSVDSARPFSLPGDSGSVILEEATGHPLALLFAGDGVHTTACDLGPLCRRLRAWPI